MTNGERPCGIDGVWPQLLARAHAGGDLPRAADRVALSPVERRLLELYVDFLEPGPDGLKVLAHLGQSLDGRIATADGHSTYVTCESDLVHMHRLRALADAVLVGGGTVAQDDPQLTVRLVPGPSPVRVVIDTDRRLGCDRRVFRDAGPETLVFCRRDRLDGATRLARAELVGLVADDGGRLPPPAILDALRARGLRRVFIEGGGVTVSRFLEARCLDRLQLCIAPVIIGSGRESVRLSPIASMRDALRLDTDVVPLGGDWLFACRLQRRPLGLGVGKPEQVRMADAKAPPLRRNPAEAHL